MSSEISSEAVKTRIRKEEQKVLMMLDPAVFVQRQRVANS